MDDFFGVYLNVLFYLYLVPAALSILGTSVYAVTLVYVRQRSLLLRVVPVGVASAVLFWLPFLLWVFDALPNYLAADAFAFAGGVFALILSGRWVRRAVEPVESPKTSF